MVAGEERHPGQVLLHPRTPTQVADLGVHGVGLVEEPFGVAERTAEHLGEPACPQRLAEMDLIADLAELTDGLTEVAPGRVEVALHLRRRAAQPERLGMRDPIAGSVGPFEHVGEHVARLHQRARLDQALRHQQQRRLQRRVVGIEAERAVDRLAARDDARPAGTSREPPAPAGRPPGRRRRGARPAVGPISATSSAAHARW